MQNSKTQTNSISQRIIATAFCAVFACAMMLSSIGCSQATSYNFKYWTDGSQSLAQLKNYVEDVTNENSSNYIPPEDRIATFDMDGTLIGEKAPIYSEWKMYAHRVLEDPDYKDKASVKQIETANQIIEAGKTGVIPENLELDHATCQAEVFAGLTIEQYRDYVRNYMQSTQAEGFENLTYADSFFKPMVEIIDYLNANNFICYICSGTDRDTCRTVLEGKVDIPFERIIGMDVDLEASGQNGKDGLEYNLTKDDQMVRKSTLKNKAVKANKPRVLQEELGRKAVLSFGNSTGDTSMHTWVTSGNSYKSMAFMVLADDEQREHGNVNKAAELKTKWEANGWVVFSMKDDFKVIYEDNVVNTQKA